MKVIAKGRKQKGWSKEFTCTGKGNGDGGCGAKLLVEQEDIYETGNHSYDGSSTYYSTFTCCDCGVQTDIDSSNGVRIVPSSVRKKLLKHGVWLKIQEEEKRKKEKEKLDRDTAGDFR